jgi:Transposase DDE domain
VLDAAVSQVLAAEPVAIPLLARFTEVIVQDSSVINLPADLVEVWRGCGGSNGQSPSALKTQVRFDVLTGALQVLAVDHGRTHDRRASVQQTPLPVGALRLSDLGYFSLSALRACGEQGAFFVTRMLSNTAVFDAAGTRVELGRLIVQGGPRGLDCRVRIGSTEKLAVRLLAVPVSQEVADQRRRRLAAEGRRRGQTVSKASLALAAWTILVTNTTPEQLSLHEALVLSRVRWQIELLFKLWKQHGKVDDWRSAKPWRILTEVYAKLTAMVVQHWLFLVVFWAYPDRSLVQASATVRRFAILLACGLAGVIDLTVALDQIQRCLHRGCRINPRRKHPNTYQLLLDLPDAA